jgi:hypothetical protein
MKRAIAILLAVALVAGAGLAQARGGGGGGRGGGGGHVSGGGHVGSVGHPGGGQFRGGPPHFTTGPTHFTTGPIHFTGRPPVGHPIVGTHHGPVFVGQPHHRVIVSGAVVVGAPWFWWPPYPYPYYPPVYGGSAYTEPPTYIEQGTVYYWCPDYQDYYPNVPNCPSPWVQVVPGASGYPN